MADAVTLEFLGAQMERMLARQDQLQEDMRVLTAIVLRHENTLIDVLQQIRTMVLSISASTIACAGLRNSRRNNGSSWPASRRSCGLGLDGTKREHHVPSMCVPQLIRR